MYKIKAVVKFNNGEALVLNKIPIIKYERYGDMLVGLDEYCIFANCYYYQAPDNLFKAFGGDKFKIPMTDGSFVEANGQWWDGGESKFTKILGSKIIIVTISDIESLKKCYVFFGYKAVLEEYIKFRKTYTGKIYEYYEYECELISKKRAIKQKGVR